MEHVAYAYTVGMDEAEVERRLETTDTGVLALCGDGEAYAIPLAHYYDDGRLYFRLGMTAGSRKRAFLETTDWACYVLYGTESTDDPKGLDSWAVIVTGDVTELPEDDYDRFDTAEINRQFSPIRIFDETVEDIDVVIAELAMETVTGRKTTA